MRIVKLHGTGMYSWVKYCRLRCITLDKDCIIAMIGDTGSGKSESSVCIGIMCYFDYGENEITNPTPEQEQGMIDWVNKYVIFDPEEINSRLKEEHPKNTWFVIEEVGVSLDSQTWHNKQQRALKHLFQTIRYKNYGCILTTPNLTFIQSSVRVLFPMVFEPQYINREENKCYIKPRFSKVDKRDGKQTQGMGLSFYDAEGEFPDWVNLWGIPRLPKSVRAAYKAKKDEFTKQLYEDQEKEFGTGDDQKAMVMCTNPVCEDFSKAYYPRKDGVAKRCNTCRKEGALMLVKLK